MVIFGGKSRCSACACGIDTHGPWVVVLVVVVLVVVVVVNELMAFVVAVVVVGIMVVGIVVVLSVVPCSSQAIYLPGSPRFRTVTIRPLFLVWPRKRAPSPP